MVCTRFTVRSASFNELREASDSIFSGYEATCSIWAATATSRPSSQARKRADEATTSANTPRSRQAGSNPPTASTSSCTSANPYEQVYVEGATEFSATPSAYPRGHDDRSGPGVGCHHGRPRRAGHRAGPRGLERRPRAGPQHGPRGPRGGRGRRHGAGRHTGKWCRPPPEAGGAGPVADVLRAGPGSHPPRRRLPPPGRQDPGVRLPGRPPAHPSHARPGGGAGRPGRGVRPRPQRRSRRSHRPRARLRPRARWARQRGRPEPLRGRGVRPRRLGRRRRPGSAQPVRGDARRHPQPLLVPPGAGHAGGRGRLAGPTGSPTCATTSRMRSRPAS